MPGARGSEPVVVAEKVSIAYGKSIAVVDASFVLPRGVSLIIGPNGSGKTTVLKAIAGLLKPVKGRLRVLGVDPYKHISLIARRAVYVPEGDPYPPSIRVDDLVERVSKAYGSTVVEKYLELLGLERYTGRRAGELSYGTRRRLLLLEALSLPRELILLDEPYKGLDKDNRRIVSQALAEKAGEGVSVVMASHIMPRLGIDYVVVMEDGRTTYTGEPRKEEIICTVIEC